MSDFLTLVQDLQREVGISGVAIPTVLGQTSIREKLVNWIADADIHIQKKHIDWKFLWGEYSQETVVGNATPPVPSDLNVWDQDSFYLDYNTANNRKITPLDYFTWRKGQRQGVKSNAKPSQIVVKPDNSLQFTAPPDGIYTLTADYWKTPTKMVDDTDESAIPDDYRRIIVVQAKLWYAEQQEIETLFDKAYVELNGNSARREMGLLQQLEAKFLIGQEGRTMGQGPQLTVVPE